LGGVMAAVWSPTHQARSLIQHFAAGEFDSRAVLDESIVVAIPGVDLAQIETKLEGANMPLSKVCLLSATSPRKRISGWKVWSFETPVQTWVTHLQTQFQKRIRQKDLRAQAALRQVLAVEGESSCVYEMLKLWQGWTQSENVLWIPDSDILMVEDQRKASLDPEIQSLLPRTEAEMRALFMEVAPHFILDPSDLQFQCRGSKPTGWARLQVDKGLLLFERPLRWNMKRLTQLIQGQVQILKLVRQFSKLRRQTVTDDLTGLYNHRHLFPCLEYEIERTSQLQSQFSVLFIDVDRFKQVNDQHGHLVGSELLSQLGALMRRRTRTTDLSFRYGGDEYLIILRGAKGTDAAAVGERLRKAVADTSFVVAGCVFKLTLSIGVATYPENAMTSEEIIRIADEAMYSGKRKSRNVVQRAA
ncbi:MAG: GGDEF domain-containing protein, partial [Bdellovibrionales bacterium]|nr:GGDEF domain-containing protein [Bdellovibrionales bacterium]